MTDTNQAHGAPGISGRWTSSAKSGIGKSLGAGNTLSFTISHGILNEIYYPRQDNACIRDMEFLVADGKGYFSEEKRNTYHETTPFQIGVPAYRIVNSSVDGRYTITKEIVADPSRNSILQQITFNESSGETGLSLYALLAPHIGNQSADNNGWLDEYKGNPMLFAERQGINLAMACSLPWKKKSVGFVGESDGYTDLKTHGEMRWEYGNASKGNIALMGEIDLSSQRHFTIAIAFGRSKDEAAQHAHASLIEGFERCRSLYIKQWTDWLAGIEQNRPIEIVPGKLFQNSIAVLRMHESLEFSGAIIASLSIPWGNTKGDQDIGGYHLVWPRDLVECSGGFLAFHAYEDAFRILNYLIATQEPDGHWPQNMWLEGSHHWNGLQLDQVALPILLIRKSLDHNILQDHKKRVAWICVRRAAIFLMNYGPISPQERWEEESGISISTIAACIASLLAAGAMADNYGEPELAAYCRTTADYWNVSLEDWLYVTDTALAHGAGVDGYYIRLNPTGCSTQELDGQMIGIKNRPDSEKFMAIDELVSVDALALVRYGLRKADDSKILNTVRVIDSKLKVTTKSGDGWHRYNNDGYGEHADGSAYDGTGIGRLWPLLTGERAHYEIAVGNMPAAHKLLTTMENFSKHDLLPEQIWDSDDVPDRELFNGRPSGSAMPLVWAHAEYVKLCASISKGKIIDMPTDAEDQLTSGRPLSTTKIWMTKLPLQKIQKGYNLRIQVDKPATIRWSADDWQTYRDDDVLMLVPEIRYFDILTENLQPGKLRFTFYWKELAVWEGKDYVVDML